MPPQLVILLHAAISRFEVGVATLEANKNRMAMKLTRLFCNQHPNGIVVLLCIALEGGKHHPKNIWGPRRCTRYLFTCNGATLHLPDPLHLLLHLLLLHQHVKVLLLHLVLSLQGGDSRGHMKDFKSLTLKKKKVWLVLQEDEGEIIQPEAERCGEIWRSGSFETPPIGPGGVVLVSSLVPAPLPHCWKTLLWRKYDNRQH